MVVDNFDEVVGWIERNCKSVDIEKIKEERKKLEYRERLEAIVEEMAKLPLVTPL